MMKQSVMKGGAAKPNVFMLFLYFFIALSVQSIIVNLTYNQVIPEIFQGASPITFYESVMLVLLCMVLFQ